MIKCESCGREFDSVASAVKHHNILDFTAIHRTQRL